MAHNDANEGQTRSHNGATDRDEHRPTSFGVFDPLRHVIDHMSQNGLSRSKIIIRDRVERMIMYFVWHHLSLAFPREIVEALAIEWDLHLGNAAIFEFRFAIEARK
jgi:hypothetical protein